MRDRTRARTGQSFGHSTKYHRRETGSVCRWAPPDAVRFLVIIGDEAIC